MNKTHFSLSILLLLFLSWSPASSMLHAQDRIPVSVKDLAPSFGIRPQFLDDTIHIVRYLDSLSADNHAMTDSCVTLNARLLAMANVLLYDYRHSNDTVWIDATHYLEDYNTYSRNISAASDFVLKRAHSYIEKDHIKREAIQMSMLNVLKDSINEFHRTIINACDGIGVSSKDRKKELKDIYYCYLAIYNRYDFSMKRNDSIYIAELQSFKQFQNDLINDLLGSNNYTVRINNFTNTLRIRCGHTHTDILRSYQRTFQQTTIPVNFSSISEYYRYISQLQNIIKIQESYLTVVDLRETITASNKRITSLFNSDFKEASRTYQEVANNVNTVPAFNNLTDAKLFINDLEEFIKVQERYVSDYNRLSRINEQSDTILKRCPMRFADIAKAYRIICDINPMTPRYRTLSEADRFTLEMDRFEVIQRQYDSIINMRNYIDQAKDSITKGWVTHMTVYNGFQNIRKNYVLTPSFIDIAGGSQFIDNLSNFIAIQNQCLHGIQLNDQYKKLDETLVPAIQPYRNMRKAYSRLEKFYLTIKTINHVSDLNIYCQQYEAFIIVQQHMLEKSKGDDAVATDNSLKNIKDIDKIELILGL